MTDDITTTLLDLSTRSLALTADPGLGLVLDEAKLARYRFEPVATA